MSDPQVLHEANTTTKIFNTILNEEENNFVIPVILLSKGKSCKNCYVWNYTAKD